MSELNSSNLNFSKLMIASSKCLFYEHSLSHLIILSYFYIQKKTSSCFEEDVVYFYAYCTTNYLPRRLSSPVLIIIDVIIECMFTFFMLLMTKKAFIF